MAHLGLICLGAFIGWVVSFGLIKVPSESWKKPATVFAAVISAAVAGGVFTFIKFMGGTKLGDALFLYPVGLAYGALVAGLIWLGEASNQNQRWLHIGGVVGVGVLILVFLFTPPLRALLPP